MHEKKHGFRYCKYCQNKLRKHGKTAAGTQRWRCLKCASSTTHTRRDLARVFEIERFISWMLGKLAQHELEHASRTFREHISWCWSINVPPVLTGEVHHTIIIDGIRVGGMVCLIAMTNDYVIAWQWVPYESSEYWSKLFNKLPQPKYVVCDGQKGLLKAIDRCWPDTIVQRCRFHAWLNIKKKLTLHPKTKAGQQLLALTRGLLRVRTKRQARCWKRQLKHWYKKNHEYMDERTEKENPKPKQRPWNYTHPRLRSAYRQLNKIADDLLRSSYRPDPTLRPTTNLIEGGVNSQIRLKLKAHRGMPKDHQRKLVDWYLYSLTEAQKTTRFCL